MTEQGLGRSGNLWRWVFLTLLCQKTVFSHSKNSRPVLLLRINSSKAEEAHVRLSPPVLGTV